MRFSRAASYNNPHEMFPSASKLFGGMNAAAGGIAKSSGKTSRASSMSVVNEGEDGESDSTSLFLPVPNRTNHSAAIVLHELTITKHLTVPAT